MPGQAFGVAGFKSPGIARGGAGRTKGIYPPEISGMGFGVSEGIACISQGYLAGKSQLVGVGAGLELVVSRFQAAFPA